MDATNDLSEYQELYVQTGREYIQSLNASLLALEDTPTDTAAIEEIFRSAHSLKSQSAAMGFESTGYLCHVIEDVFYEIKNNRLALSPQLADQLFKALDGLTNSLNHIEKQSQEIDLSATAGALKHFSGVTTAGAGKTEHTDSAVQATEPRPAAVQPLPKVGAVAPTHSTPTAARPPASPTTAAAPAGSATAPAPESRKVEINTIAVKVDVLDEMMNLIENLLIERLKLKQADDQPVNQADLKAYMHASEKIMTSLQYQIMKARAVPVSVVFDHFPRAVRDLARTENKEVKLVITGSDLELDRTIVDRLDEPLIHLLRNAVSHGIKDKGTITLSAKRQKDYAEISVADDGSGIDWQRVAEKAGLPPHESNPLILKEALFSGISTSESVTQISGRGVGLMVIKKMVDNFGGGIDVLSEPGKGTIFSIKLPLTLAIAKAVVVLVNQKHFAIPTLNVERLVSIPASSVKKIAGQEACILDGREIPLIRLAAKLSPVTQPINDVQASAAKNLTVVVVGGGHTTLGLAVDQVIDTADLVIKPVPDVLKSVRGFSGVTILNDGSTALILNTQELF